MTKTRSVLALALAAAAAGAAQPLAAQTLLTPAAPAKGVWLDAAYTDYAIGGEEMSVQIPSAVWYLSGRLPLTPRLSGVVDVPFSYARISAGETREDDETNSVLGNPYLGVEFAATPRLRLELGARAPLNTADSESFADVAAMLADPLRVEAFAEDVVPVSGAATWTQPLTGALELRLHGGATAFFLTGDDAAGNEAALDYGAAGTYTVGLARLGLGVTGRWNATADEGSFADRSLHFAGASADVLVRGVRPGISVRVPLDEDYREVVMSTVGLYLQVPLQ